MLNSVRIGSCSSFQIIPSMLRSDKSGSYTYLNIQELRPIEIGKWLIIYYLLTYEEKLTNHDVWRKMLKTAMAISFHIF